VGVDARNHNGDFALALIAKGTGYFGHGGKNRIGWESRALGQGALKVQQHERLMNQQKCQSTAFYLNKNPLPVWQGVFNQGINWL